MHDLEAIRARNDERKAQFVPEEWGADNDIRAAVADIDALLAEVERCHGIIRRTAWQDDGKLGKEPYCVGCGGRGRHDEACEIGAIAPPTTAGVDPDRPGY